ncbi:MAG: MFS transporter [Verrucomicrobia bacterium]|nr:MFS transporter [Verrucomicrobiota bacterium]
MSTTSALPYRHVTLCVALAAFVFQFEAFQVVVALPSITTQFGMTPAGSALVLVLYLLAATVMFVPAGRWGESHGLKRGFVAGAVILGAGTALCSVAPNAAMLLAARLLQGAGAGCLVALGYALIPARMPREHIGAALGMVSFASAAGLTTGAPVGGLMTEFLSWRWALLAIVPLAGALAWCSVRYIPDDPPRAGCGSLAPTLPGIVLLTVLMGGLLLGLGLGPVWGWRSPRVLALLLAAAVAAVTLAVRQQRAKAPLIARLVWRERRLPPALATLGLVRAAVGGMAFLTPFYLEGPCGASPAVSGVVLLGYTIACAVTGLCAGALSDRLGSQSLVRIGTLVAVAACALSAAAASATGLWQTALLLAALGVGTGLFYSPNSRFTMACAPREHEGEVAALMALALNVGTAVGVAALGALHAELAAQGGGSGPYAAAMTAAAFVFAAAAVTSLFTYTRPTEDMP